MKNKITALIAIILLVSGCARIPTSGVPYAVDRPKQTTSGIVLDPQGPAEGAEPEDIVVGFMRASSAGFSDDFVVARQYLTADASTAWNPATQVRIYPDSQNQQVSQTRSGAYRVTVGAGGILDSTGRFTAATADATLSNEFSLVREKSGQWRIAVVPDGVTMPDSLFRTLFVRVPLYFPTQDQNALVTDVRWYPRSQVASSVARGIVDGPPAWLAESVNPVLPTGTRLTNPVTIEDGTARVDLSSEVAELPQRVRNLVYAQFSKTLSAIAGISRVELTANGVPLTVQTNTDVPAYPYSASSLMVLVDGKPAVVKDDGIHPVPGAEALVSLGLTNIAIPYGETTTEFVALGNNKQTLYRVSQENGASPLVNGTALVPPSTDRKGFAWVSEREPNKSFTVANIASGTVTRVDAPWLEGVKVRALAVSREGVRLAVIVENENGVQILIAGIVRDNAGIPQSLSDPIRVGQRFADAQDIAWVSDSRLVAIGKTQSATVNSLYSVPLGENISLLSSSLEDIVDVTAGRNDESILLHTAKDEIFAYDAGGWRQVIQHASSPAYPG